MSRIIKIKQEQVETIVNQVIKEHLGEYQPTMADAQIEEEGEEQGNETPHTGNEIKAGIAKGPDGRFYVLNAETGEIIGVK